VEPGQVTLQQMREKADGLHHRVHEPDLAERDTSAAAQETAGASRGHGVSFSIRKGR